MHKAAGRGHEQVAHAVGCRLLGISKLQHIVSGLSDMRSTSSLTTCAGELRDVGTSKGHNYSVNVPLQEGVDDESYRLVFEPVLAKVPSCARLLAGMLSRRCLAAQQRAVNIQQGPAACRGSSYPKVSCSESGRWALRGTLQGLFLCWPEGTAALLSRAQASFTAPGMLLRAARSMPC